jgi:uncharacterized protein YprB with RNaseH-like and TPR domain
MYNPDVEPLNRRIDELGSPARGSGPRLPATMPGSATRGLREVVGGVRSHCGGEPHWQLTVAFDRISGPGALNLEGSAGPLQCEPRPGESVIIDPARTLVIDIETGGFSGTPVFLIGVVALDRRPLHVEQWLARDYPEEKGVLLRLAEWAVPRSTWVSFNGKAFDVPFVLDRATVYGIRLTPPRVHIDLLHLARRHWRGELPDFRLETLEREVLGRARLGDVPGCDVPDLFHHFFCTRNAAPLRPVLERNQRDLVASTELLLRLAKRRPSG